MHNELWPDNTLNVEVVYYFPDYEPVVEITTCEDDCAELEILQAALLEIEAPDAVWN